MIDPQAIAARSMRAKLEAAWRDRHGYPLECHPPESKCPYCARFRRLLDAEAWLDAAMMLVPDGWEWCVDNWDGPAEARCCAWGQYANQEPGPNQFGTTPAEALLAAILKAKEQDHAE